MYEWISLLRQSLSNVVGMGGGCPCLSRKERKAYRYLQESGGGGVDKNWAADG